MKLVTVGIFAAACGYLAFRGYQHYKADEARDLTGSQRNWLSYAEYFGGAFACFCLGIGNMIA